MLRAPYHGGCFCLFSLLLRRSLSVLGLAFCLMADTAWTAEVAGDPAAVLHEAATRAYREGRYLESAEQIERALAAGPALSPALTHDALNLLGQARTRLGENRRALEALERAERLAADRGFRAGLARTYIYVGDVYERMKQHPRALDYYRKALDTVELPADWREARLAWVQIGDIHVVAGRFDEARAAYVDALRLARDAGDEELIAYSLDYLGYFHRRIGDAEQAIKLHRQAIQYASRLAAAQAATALGRAYNHLGLSQQLAAFREEDAQRKQELLRQAIASEEQALLHAQRAQDRWRQGYILRALSTMHRDLAQIAPGERDAHLRNAVQRAQQARGVAGEMGNPEWEGLALHHLATAQARLGNLDDAARAIEHALEIWERIGDTYSRGWALRMRAEEIAERRGDHAGARTDYFAALQAFDAVQARDDMAQVYHRLGASLTAGGERAAAIYFGKQAVNAIQGMRERLRNLDRESQRAFVEVKAAIYRSLADLLIDEGRLAEAQQVLGMLKEEEFFDFLRRDSQRDPRVTRAALTSQEEEWQRRYRAVSDRIAALGVEFEALRQKARGGLSEAEQARREELRKDLETARKAFDRIVAQILAEAVQAGGARAIEIGARQLDKLRALQGTLGELGHGAVLVHYLVGENRLRILLTTPSAQIARETAITARELNRQVASFRKSLQDPRLDPLGIARQLYDVLVQPIANDLRQAGARTLMLSLDGTLRYVPFAALFDGSRYLVEDFRLSVFTEAAQTALKDLPQREWRVAGLGLTRRIEGFSPLPAVREELEGIVKHGDRGVLPGEMHLDDEFTALRIREALDRAYPVLHIASHFRFEPGTERDSFLLLGDGTRLTLGQFREHEFDLRYIDLLTLSACDTAVGGGRDANGQEIEGFGALAQQQGAKGVIATLWPVADRSTGLLMQNLYRFRVQQGATKAEALRQAQLALIRTAAAGGAADGARGAQRVIESPREARRLVSEGYSHPFFWAPFILMGNWL